METSYEDLLRESITPLGEEGVYETEDDEEDDESDPIEEEGDTENVGDVLG